MDNCCFPRDFAEVCIHKHTGRPFSLKPQPSKQQRSLNPGPHIRALIIRIGFGGEYTIFKIRHRQK